MNSSEIKRTIWSINLFIILILSFLLYFVQQQLSTPAEKLTPFVYHETTLNENIKSESKLISRQEVEKGFGWKKPEVLPEPPIGPKDQGILLAPKPVIEKTENINQILSVETILGRLAFILIKKDKQTKCFVVGDEILDNNNESIGFLKQINDDGVLVLHKGKIELLTIESDAFFETGTRASANEILKTTFGANLKEQTVKKHPITMEKETTNPKETIDDSLFIVNQETEADGMIHRKITNELAVQLDSKEWYQKMSSAKSYELEFQSKGILIKNIKDLEAKKVLNAFGILDADIIISVNGQSLGNKTEDDLVLLYQQIKGSAKFATIELQRNGALQKFKISVKK